MSNSLKKKTLILLGIVVFLLVTGTFYILSQQKNNNNQNTQTNASLHNVSYQQIAPPVVYDKTSVDKMISILQNRPKLSDSDTIVRKKIIDNIGSTSGIVSQTDTYTLEYIQEGDEFMTEIKSTDISKTKDEVTSWLKDQGLSQAGICNLPLVFYINHDTALQLSGTSTKFDPLPNNC